MKLLCLCDSPTLQTGFARVAQNLLRRWAGANFFEQIWVWGIGYHGFPHALPYRICPAQTIQSPHWYLPRSLQLFLQQLKSENVGGTPGGYTHVWILQDTFLLDGLCDPAVVGQDTLRSLCSDLGISTALYFPVDAPLEPSWTRIIADVDAAVAYCDYGRREAQNALSVPLKDGKLDRRRMKRAEQIRVLPHGVDRSVYYHAPEGDAANRDAARQMMFQGVVAESDFLMVNVSQHQKRKGLVHSLATLKALREVSAGSGINPKLYLHLPQKNADEGTDLRSAAIQMGFVPGRDVFFSDGNFYNNHALLPEASLNAIYNAADLVLSTSYGEGWGLPLTEAMCAGTPVAGPQHTAIAEILGDGRGILYDTAGVDLITRDNSRLRPRPDPEDAALRIFSAIGEDGIALAQIGAAGEAWARSDFLDWDRIAAEWLKIFAETAK